MLIALLAVPLALVICATTVLWVILDIGSRRVIVAMLYEPHLHYPLLHFGRTVWCDDSSPHVRELGIVGFELAIANGKGYPHRKLRSHPSSVFILELWIPDRLWLWSLSFADDRYSDELIDALSRGQQSMPSPRLDDFDALWAAANKARDRGAVDVAERLLRQCVRLVLTDPIADPSAVDILCSELADIVVARGDPAAAEQIRNLASHTRRSETKTARVVHDRSKPNTP